MKRAFLDDARPEDVSHALREVVERRGGLVSEHVSSHVRFTHRPVGRSWLRQGYVGIFQPLGEPEVELLLVLRARWTWRLFWGVALANVLLLLALFVLQSNGNTWILCAMLGGFALLVTGLLHLNTLQPVREEEQAWILAFEEELRRELPAVAVEDAVERERRDAELLLEGELAHRRVARARKNEPKAPRAQKGRRFSLLPGKRSGPAASTNEPAETSVTEESPEEKRARLLARKAELEARQRENDER